MNTSLASGEAELYKSFAYLRDEIRVTSDHPDTFMLALPAGYRLMASASVSRLNLLDLPLELREDIFSRTFFCRPATAFFNPIQRGQQRCHCLRHSLNLVCHSIRIEVLSHFYRTHEVHFILNANDKPALLAWLSTIDEGELAMIQRFRIKSKEPCRLGHRPRLVKVNVNAQQQVILAHSCCKITRLEMQWRLEETLETLPISHGRVVLTKDGLRAMFEVVGWFQRCYDLL